MSHSTPVDDREQLPAFTFTPLSVAVAAAAWCFIYQAVCPVNFSVSPCLGLPSHRTNTGIIDVCVMVPKFTWVQKI